MAILKTTAFRNDTLTLSPDDVARLRRGEVVVVGALVVRLEAPKPDRWDAPPSGPAHEPAD